MPQASALTTAPQNLPYIDTLPISPPHTHTHHHKHQPGQTLGVWRSQVQFPWSLVSPGATDVGTTSQISGSVEEEELAQGGDRGEGEMVKCVLRVGVGLGETFFKDRGQNQPLGLQPILG